MRIDQVLERLQTPAGKALVAELAKRVQPSIEAGADSVHDSFLSESRKALLPKDGFDGPLVRALFEHQTMMGETERALPAAVADVLMPLVDKNGFVDAAKVAQVLGPRGLAFLDKLGAAGAQKTQDPMADRLTFNMMASSEAKEALKSAPFIAPNLPALDMMRTQIAKPDELKGFQFLGLQHLFASSGSLFDAIGKVGVLPEDMHLIGKIYSTNFRVAAEMESRGATVDGVSKRVASDFAESMDGGIRSQLNAIIEKLPKATRVNVNGKVHLEPKPTPQVVLIDDGAEAIKMLHEKFPEYAGYFVCVEQTRRGARVLHELAEKGELLCPVVNVAETWAKLDMESPMIGHSVVLEVGRKLDKLEHANVPVSKSALVMGYGAVGKEVAKSLAERGFTVHIYDKDPTRLKDLPKGFVAHTSKDEALPHAGVLVSCVGARTLELDDQERLPAGAVLVNAASADDELGPQDLLRFSKKGITRDDGGHLWGVFQGKPVDLGLGDAQAHSDRVVKLASGKELLVVNNGFVVNMTGERDPIPPRYIQLTRGLLFLGAITAARADKPGILDVPMEWQQALVNRVQRELRKTGEDLTKPNWEKFEKAPPDEVRTPPAGVLEDAQREAGLLPPVVEGPGIPGKQIGKTEDAGMGVDAVGKRLYGYVLGPTERATVERAIAMQVEGKDVLTMEAAALHKVTVGLNKLTGRGMRATLTPDSAIWDGMPKPVSSSAQALQLSAPPMDEQRFQGLYGHFSKVLVGIQLAKDLQRQPTAPELARQMKALWAIGKLPVDGYLSGLRASPSPDDQALLQALTATGT